MREQKFEIFGRTHFYYNSNRIKKDIEVISDSMKRISEPQILSYCGMETIDMFIKDDDFITRDCVFWIYNQNKARLSEESIRSCLLKCSVEDEEWTKQRNKEFTDIFYRKITFLPEIQSAVRTQLQKYLEDLTSIYNRTLEEERKEKAALNERKIMWSVGKVYGEILPKGGENGTDGYYDAEYVSSKTDERIRMVMRDVFDVGTYSYPKRLEGLEDVFDYDKYTAAEKDLSVWLREFGKFKGFRM